MVIDLRSDRPVYKQLADVLREQISSGTLTPGAPVPSEKRLMQEYGISRNTVRLAIYVLRVEGLVRTEHSRGTFIRERRTTYRLSSHRYHASGTPNGERAHTTAYHEVPADARLAELLGVSEGTALLERRFTFYARDEPQQVSISYYPLATVAGTPVADPANEPWPGGNITQLATLGIEVTDIEESVTARMPMPEEADTLDVSEGIPVLTITRRMLAGDKPVEVADIVIPADRVVLDYAIKLRDLMP